MFLRRGASRQINDFFALLAPFSLTYRFDNFLLVSARRQLARNGDDWAHDLDIQPGTKERLFEEEMEVVWDKGSSGLVFYTGSVTHSDSFKLLSLMVAGCINLASF